MTTETEDYTVNIRSFQRRFGYGAIAREQLVDFIKAKGEDHRNILNNTVVWLRSDGTVDVQYHRTIIIKYLRNGDKVVNCGGWSASLWTMKRLHWFVPFDRAWDCGGLARMTCRIILHGAPPEPVTGRTKVLREAAAAWCEQWTTGYYDGIRLDKDNRAYDLLRTEDNT